MRTPTKMSMPSDDSTWVNLSRIPPEKRKAAWERLKQNYPAQAALCEDPLVVEMRRVFNAELIIELPKESE